MGGLATRSVKLFLTETLISTITGGYYYNGQNNLFVNVAHIYLWTIFFFLPLFLIFSGINRFIGAAIFTLLVLILFIITKYLNLDFHKQIDKNLLKLNKEIELETNEKENDKDKKKDKEIDDENSDHSAKSNYSRRSRNRSILRKTRVKDPIVDKKEKIALVTSSTEDDELIKNDKEKKKDRKKRQKKTNKKQRKRNKKSVKNESKNLLKEQPSEDNDGLEKQKPKSNENIQDEKIKTFVDQYGVVQRYIIKSDSDELTVSSDTNDYNEKSESSHSDNPPKFNKPVNALDFVADDLTIEQINRLIAQTEGYPNFDDFQKATLEMSQDSELTSEEKIDEPSFVRLPIFKRNHYLYIDRLTLESLFDRDWKLSQGTISVLSSLIEVIKDIIVFGIVYIFGYLSYNSQNKQNINESIKFSIFNGLLIGFSFLLSKTPTNPRYLKKVFQGNKALQKEDIEPEMRFDFLPIRKFLIDILHSILLFVIYTLIHLSKIFQSGKIYQILLIIGLCVGIISHYFFNQFRKSFPFQIFGDSFLTMNGNDNFEETEATTKKKYEIFYRFLILIEKYILIPSIAIFCLTDSIPDVIDKFGIHFSIFASIFIVIKFIRSGFNNGEDHYKILFLLLIFFQKDFQIIEESKLINLFVSQYAVERLCEATLKIKFFYIYSAPWTKTISSISHAILSLLSIAHLALTIIFIFIATIFSMPLSPFIGSGLFLLTYARPIRYWEKSYRTKRIDDSNTKLATTLSISANNLSNLNNLNSIFYEHLYVSLRDTLYNDIKLGRLGKVSQGDFFLLLNDSLTCLLHISSLGNGFCCYQLRGLEFRGTYCQEREIEEVKSTAENSDENAIFPNSSLLSFRYMWLQRWRTWEVINESFIARSYNVIMNPAEKSFEMFETQKILIKYFISTCIFYLFQNYDINELISDTFVFNSINNLHLNNYTESDPLIFSKNSDLDWDKRKEGITVRSFEKIYGNWIKYCITKYNEQFDEEQFDKKIHFISLIEMLLDRKKKKRQLNKEIIKKNKLKNLQDYNKFENEIKKKKKILGSNSPPLILNLCYALSLAARRVLGTASLSGQYLSTDRFLDRYYALFKGDLRLDHRDDWILSQVTILQNVIGKSAKISLNLYQYYFISPDEYNDPKILFDTLLTLENEILICAESDPEWRKGILTEKNNLLSLRCQTNPYDSSLIEYFIMQLELRHMKYLLVKMNKECVRGLWSSQIQELVYLKNLNHERGSIQKCENVLRNLQNQACDIPTGYPISISPICTSYSTNSDKFFYQTLYDEFFNIL
ncbi:protein pecanex [Anaeramoeba flamelloides]|uniref:Protein pecanex n=1 Tax=Anaeramoeba flamelloides TaxID=1746091 RepID=A0AAV7YUD7_9EUKA|nr:protein pecanex [Anaeramoeba flamelloides]